MSRSDERAEIAEFIRSRGAIRCPTACLTPTQGTVSAVDKLALSRHAQDRQTVRQLKLRSIAAALALPATAALLRHCPRNRKAHAMQPIVSRDRIIIGPVVMGR